MTGSGTALETNQNMETQTGKFYSCCCYCIVYTIMKIKNVKLWSMMFKVCGLRFSRNEIELGIGLGTFDLFSISSLMVIKLV